MKLQEWNRSPDSPLRIAGLVAAMTTLLLLLNTAVAAAGDLPDIGIDLSKAQRLSDSEMGQLRGRFAVNGQPILSFGLLMQSSLGPQTGQPGDVLSAGVAFGVDLSGKTPKITTNMTWTTQSDPGLASPGLLSGGGSGPLGKLNGGIGQVVQIAGQGNSAANVATIDLTTTPPAPLVSPTVPGGTACDALCQAEITKNGIRVMVSMPGEGSATQTINPQSIVQGVMLNGNLAQALNSLQLEIQLGPTNPESVSALSTVLQTIPMLPH
jgi:hypothetical protein